MSNEWGTPSSYSKYEAGDKIASSLETDEEIYARVNIRTATYQTTNNNHHYNRSSSDESNASSAHGSIQDYGEGSESIIVVNNNDPHGPAELYTNSEMRTFANLVKSYIGSGVLGLPYAFYQGGIIVSIFFLIFLAALCNYAIKLLIQCADALEKRHGLVGFGDIGQILYGKVGRILVDASIVFTQTGFCCVYIIFIGTNLNGVYSGIPVWGYVLLILPVLIFTCWLRSLKYLAFVSVTGQAVMLIGLGIIMFYSVESLIETTPPVKAINIRGLPIFFGMAVYTYEGIGLVIPMRRAMIEPHRYSFVMDLAYILMTLLYVFFGAAGYLGYGANLNEQSITLNLPPDSIFTPITQLALVYAIFATYPIQIFPVIGLAEAFLFTPKSGKWFTANELAMTWRKNLIRTLIVTASAIVAISIPYFSLFVSLVGAFGSSILAFILPTLFHLKMFRRSSSTLVIVGNYAILIFGIIASFVSTTVTVYQLIRAIFHLD